jgi:hypothetical protein
LVRNTRNEPCEGFPQRKINLKSGSTVNASADNEIECPRCGASVYYELTRCPECGLNFYPSEGSAFEEDVPEPPSWLGKIGIYPVAVVLAWLASAMAFFLIHFISGSFTGWVESALVLRIIFLIADLAISLGAGYLAGALADENQIAHGLASGILISATRILFEAFWYDLDSSGIFTPWMLLAWGMIMMGVWIGALLARNRSLRVDHILFESHDQPYSELLTMVGYDRDIAERLIDYERQRSPTANRKIWLKNAISRWNRDNRTL